jgi:hypothetical protein
MYFFGYIKCFPLRTSARACVCVCVCVCVNTYMYIHTGIHFMTIYYLKHR